MLLLFSACEKSTSDDKYFWLTAHAFIPQNKDDWNLNKAVFKGYVGQYYGFGDIIQPYQGKPEGPLVMVWQIITHPAPKPQIEECLRPTDDLHIDIHKERDKWDAAMAKHEACYKDRVAKKEASTKRKYFYARSLLDQIITLPAPAPGHSHYDMHISYGPLGDVPLEGLTQEQLLHKEKLTSSSCVRTPSENTCYRLPGHDTSVYYTVRSIRKAQANPERGEVVSEWEVADDIRDQPHSWKAIHGIQINKAQYEYLRERCNRIKWWNKKCFLDEAAPDLNNDQLVYIRTHKRPEDEKNNLINMRDPKETSNPWK